MRSSLEWPFFWMAANFIAQFFTLKKCVKSHLIVLHRAPPPKRSYFAVSAHFLLRVLTPTFTAYILATHWLRGGYTRTVTIWGSYSHFHLLTSCSTYRHSSGFPPLTDCTAHPFIHFSSIHPSLLPKRMLLEVEGNLPNYHYLALCASAVGWGGPLGWECSCVWQRR
jgi:hypothetical protein